MNDEYLWDKTGENSEIERLEGVLAVFRYRETAKATIFATQPTDEKVSRWRFTLKLAFASCVAIGVVTMVGLRFSSDGSDAVNSSDVVFVQQTTDVSDADPVMVPELPPARNSDRQDRPSGNRRRSIGRTTAAFHGRPKAKYAAPAAELTAEEQFAYRQLMLALSITGSKLKIVQDTIDGTEDLNDDSKNQR
jgi:hypothetical protein